MPTLEPPGCGTLHNRLYEEATPEEIPILGLRYIKG